jgi:hypothetical protein
MSAGHKARYDDYQDTGHFRRISKDYIAYDMYFCINVCHDYSETEI